MNENEVRALVRQVIAARLSPASAPAAHAGLGEPLGHSSHGLLRMAPGVEKGQPCVIEPHVACGLCGFCQSLGH